MAYRIVQWGTGAAGSEAIRAIAADPGLELVGVRVFTEAKDGRDAGEIAGVDELGVAATRDTRAILDLEADCVLFAAGLVGEAGLTLDQNDEDVIALLASGKNVVSLCPGAVWPEARGGELAARLEQACATGSSTLYGTGINPGYFLERLAPALCGMSRDVQQVRLREVWDGTNYPSEAALFEMVGFGKPAEWLATAPFIPVLTAWIHESLYAITATLGHTVSGFDRTYEYGLATRDVPLLAGTIPAGTLGAVGWTWTALVDGRPFATVHNQWIGDWQLEGWGDAHEHYWQVDVRGLPDVSARVSVTDTFGPLPGAGGPIDRTTSGIAVAAALSAVPGVVAAVPGVLRRPVPVGRSA